MNCFYKAPDGMQTKPCGAYAMSGVCTNLKCCQQHRRSSDKQGHNGAPLLKLKPAQRVFFDFAIKKWDMGCGTAQGATRVVKVEVAVNRAMEHRFTERQKHLKDLYGQSISIIWAFHGTAQANIQAILQSGFQTQYQLNNAYGVGTYFARDPNVSVSYCKGGNQMILCQICIGKQGQKGADNKIVPGSGDHLWVDPPAYYIIPDVASINPVLLVTFK